MIELHPYQQIFMIFFAILYGTMLYSCNRFNPFPFIGFGNLTLGEKRLFGDVEENRKQFCRCRKWRLLLSIILLNVGPFLYFLFVYFHVFSWLSSIEDWKIFLIAMFFALSIFTWYRLYRGFIIWRKNDVFCDILRVDKTEGWKRFGDLTTDSYLDFIASIFYFCLPWIVVFLVSCIIWEIIVGLIAIFVFIFVFRDC